MQLVKIFLLMLTLYFYSHAGFAISWGEEVERIQSPAGYRSNIMSTNFEDWDLKS
jgi:hypothetical protein